MSGGTSFRVHASGSAAMPLPASAHAGIDSDFSHLGWAAGFFFSFRTILVFVCVRWLNVGTELGVLGTFAISSVLLIVSMVQAFGGSAQPLGPVGRIPVLRWVLYSEGIGGSSGWMIHGRLLRWM